jgi:hypothetical protein
MPRKTCNPAPVPPTREQLLAMPLVNREQLHTLFLLSGYPISRSRLDKLCMPTCGEGPLPAQWFGKRPLYRPDRALAWIEARCRSTAPWDSPESSSTARSRPDSASSAATAAHPD